MSPAAPAPLRAHGQGRWRHKLAQWPAWLQQRARYIYRRWVYACAAFFAVLGLSWLWHAEAVEEVWQAERALMDVQRQVDAVPRALAATSEAVPVPEESALAHLPSVLLQSRLWPALQQSLERQHLELLSLVPVHEPVQAPLPSQAVALRLRGRFEDWVRAWTGLHEGAAVWSLERVRVTPQAQGAQDEIDVVMRVWLRADAPGPLAWQGRGLADPAPTSVVTGAVFAHTLAADSVMGAARDTAELAAVSASSAAQDSPDPLHWPLAQVRLLGVWQEADAHYAILAFGPHWVLAPLGQRVGQQGHRLAVIGDRFVGLRAGRGPVLELGFERAGK